MKTIPRFFLIVMLTAMLACLAVQAEGAAVYVSENGSDANTGASAAEGVATLTRACELLSDAGGTIYISGTVAVDSNAKNGAANVFEAPAHSGKIRLTGVDASATLKFGDVLHWYMSGEAEMDNLHILLEAADNYLWAARHNHFTVGENVRMTETGKGGIILIGGCNTGGEIEHTASASHLTLCDGDFYFVYGGNRKEVSEACCGDTLVEFLGDTYIRGAFSPGSVNRDVKNATVIIDGIVTTGSHFYFGGYDKASVETVNFVLKSGQVNCGGTFPGGIARVTNANAYYADDAAALRSVFAAYLTGPIASCCTEIGHTADADGRCLVCGAEVSKAAVEIKMTVGDLNGYVNGAVKTLDAAPVIRKDRTMLPVRFVAENLGAAVAWDGATGTATLTSGDIEIKITIGAAAATVNGEEKPLDAPAFIENSRTYLPVRFVAEALGGTVAWDGATGTATITK